MTNLLTRLTNLISSGKDEHFDSEKNHLLGLYLSSTIARYNYAITHNPIIANELDDSVRTKLKKQCYNHYINAGAKIKFEKSLQKLQPKNTTRLTKTEKELDDIDSSILREQLYNTDKSDDEISCIIDAIISGTNPIYRELNINCYDLRLDNPLKNDISFDNNRYNF